MGKFIIEQVFERVCRYYVFVFLCLYGFGKIAGGQFYRKGALPEAIADIPLSQASAFEIAWTFMGYSFAYILFIGVSQLIGAFLLLFNKTKLLGTAILIPIMLNIIVFDIIFLDQKGALVNATLYFLMLLYILYANKQRVIQAFHALIESSEQQLINLSVKERYFHLGIVLTIMALIFVLDQTLVNLVGH